MTTPNPPSYFTKVCGPILGSHQFVDYTENTTVHGIKYLCAKRRPFIDKIFWSLIFIISFVTLGFFVKDVFNKFQQNSAILVQDEKPTPIHLIPFPATTICPTVKIKSRYFPMEEAKTWFEGTFNESMILDLAYLICNQQFFNSIEKKKATNISNTSASFLNQSYIELLHMISPTIYDSFVNVKFASKKEHRYIEIIGEDDTLDVPFSYILTNEGICFTFNMPSNIINDDPTLQSDYKYFNIQNKTKSWSNEDGYWGYPRFPRSVWGSGFTSGLHALLTANSNDLNTFCQPTQIGYKIMLHSPDEYPTTLEKFISIPYNTMNKIKVTPKLTKTSEDLWYVDPQVRQCFFDRERKLKFFTYYNRVNCKLECLANYTTQKYGCVHFSLPRSKSQPICGAEIKVHELYDMEENIKSYHLHKEQISMVSNYDVEEKGDDVSLGFQEFSNFYCNCLPACNSLEYEYKIEKETIELQKIGQKYFPSDDEDDLDPTTIIDIFFGMTKVTGSTRKQFYTFTDMISNIGGLLGLFMGASILSIFEVIYFVTIR